MEFKLKENVNVNSFIFKEKVIKNILEMIGEQYNYTVNNVQFLAMIAFMDELDENYTILSRLNDVKTMADTLSNYIEPLFVQHVLEDENRLDVFNDIVNQVIDYKNREIDNEKSIILKVNSLLKEFNGISLDDISRVLNIIDQKLHLTERVELSKNKDTVKNKVANVMANGQMKELMDKYLNNANSK